jgi:restriction endonuclease
LRKGKELVAVQCKNYQRPVGNRPVQEVFAGNRHYGAKHAWVVAPAGFTKGAVQLARSTGVVLLDRSSIESFIQQTERRAEEQQASTEFTVPREQSSGGSEKQFTRRNSPARTTEGTIAPQHKGPLADMVGDVPVAQHKGPLADTVGDIPHHTRLYGNNGVWRHANSAFLCVPSAPFATQTTRGRL